MKWLIITGLLALAIVAGGAWFVLTPAPAPATRLVEIGPTPLDAEIDWAIAHSK